MTELTSARGSHEPREDLAAEQLDRAASNLGRHGVQTQARQHMRNTSGRVALEELGDVARCTNQADVVYRLWR